MPLEKKREELIGNSATIERELIGLLTIKDLEERVDGFEGAYKLRQGTKVKRELYNDIEMIKEILKSQEEVHLNNLRRIIKARNPGYFPD
jgi:hypothetical protein